MKLRPRLADHALLRRHVIDGSERVVIHHATTGALVSLDPRSADIALLADGTRDRDGVALAASQAGWFTRQSEIEALIDDLDSADLLADGIAHPAPAAAIATPVAASLAATPVEVLPDYRFACSGAGACCMQYASITLDPADRRRARDLLATLADDPEAKRVWLPLQGGDGCARSAMTLVDGSCLQLGGERRCGLHERGGFDAKPAACRSYPATFVFDGERVTVSTSVECDCVLSSLGTEAGEPLSRAAVARDLPEGIQLRVLAEEISWSENARVPRDRYLDFRRQALSAVPRASGVTLALSLAEAVRNDQPISLLAAASLEPLVSARLGAFAEAMSAAAQAADSWRSARDRTRLMRREVAAAASTLVRRGSAVTLEAGPFPEAESFTLRAALFGHQLAEGAPFSTALSDLAVRLLVARELELGGRRALGHPITVVMAAARGALRNEAAP